MTGAPGGGAGERGAGGAVSPPASVAYTSVAFFALVVAAFGMTSLLTDTEVVAIPDLGFLPGALGVAAATIAFALSTWFAVRRVRPSYFSAAATTAFTIVAYSGGVWIGALVQGADVSTATAAVVSFATSPFALALLAAAFVCAWSAVALVRTRAGRPRWPWEDKQWEDEQSEDEQSP